MTEPTQQRFREYGLPGYITNLTQLKEWLSARRTESPLPIKTLYINETQALLLALELSVATKAGEEWDSADLEGRERWLEKYKISQIMGIEVVIDEGD